MARGKRRSGLVLLLTLVASAVLTGRIYDSRDPATLSYVLSAVLVAGSVLSGGMPKAHRRQGRHPVVGPFLTGVALFAFFALAGLVVRLVPAVDRAVGEVLLKADRGSVAAVVLAAAAAGAAEEVFYRGAWFERMPLPMVTATLAHVVSTLPAGNVALTMAASLLGGVCGLSRRASGGWWTAAVVHVTWSLLCIAWLPR